MIVGLCWNNFPLQIIVLFLCLVWVNKCSSFEQLSKVIGGLVVVLGGLWSTLTNGQISGFRAFISLVRLVCLPYALTGLTLLLPYPSLATDRAISVCASISTSTTTAMRILVKSFCSTDYTDLYASQLEGCLQDMQVAVSELEQLLPLCECECMVFTSLKKRFPSLKRFCDISAKLIFELENIRDIRVKILNEVQAEFVSYLQADMVLIIDNLSKMIEIFVKELENDAIISTTRKRCFSLFGDPTESVVDIAPESIKAGERFFEDKNVDSCNDVLDENEDHLKSIVPEERNRLDSNATMIRSMEEGSTHWSKDEYDAHSPTKDYMMRSPESPIFSGKNIHPHLTIRSAGEIMHDIKKDLFEVKSRLLISYQDLRRKLVKWHIQQQSLPDNKPVVESGISLKKIDEDDEGLRGSRSVDKNAIDVELGLNIFIILGPRHSYFARLFNLMDLVLSLETALILPSHEWSYSTFLYEMVMHFLSFDCECVSIASLIELVKHNFFTCWNAHMMVPIVPASYHQPLKVALAVTGTFAIVILFGHNDFLQSGIWAVAVICLIRQESTSSSWLIGYQRLEGTVCGAFFSYLIISIFSCYTDETCSYSTTILILLFWVGLCSCFREGENHGYAAVVSAFTPMIVLLGPSSSLLSGPWLRIQMTFLGIAIWLLVDNCIWPVRSDRVMRNNVIAAISEAKVFLDASVNALHILVDVEKGDEEEAKGPSHAKTDDVAEVASIDNTHLEYCTEAMSKLSASVHNQQKSMTLLIHEPQFLNAEFPIRPYARLLNVFKRLLRAGRATNNSLISLQGVLQQMPRNVIVLHTTLFTFMNSNVFSLAQKAHVALELASESLSNVYDRSPSSSTPTFYSNPSSDESQESLTALLTLSRGVVRIQQDINRHVRNVYSKKGDEIFNLNPLFLLAWHNVFESVCELMDSLQALGASLYDIRHSEKKRQE